MLKVMYKVLAVPSAIQFVIIASRLSTCVLACKVITELYVIKLISVV